MFKEKIQENCNLILLKSRSQKCILFLFYKPLCKHFLKQKIKNLLATAHKKSKRKLWINVNVTPTASGNHKRGEIRFTSCRFACWGWTSAMFSPILWVFMEISKISIGSIEMFAIWCAKSQQGKALESRHRQNIENAEVRIFPSHRRKKRVGPTRSENPSTKIPLH